jgi:hypothetical protein
MQSSQEDVRRNGAFSNDVEEVLGASFDQRQFANWSEFPFGHRTDIAILSEFGPRGFRFLQRIHDSLPVAFGDLGIPSRQTRAGRITVENRKTELGSSGSFNRGLIPPASIVSHLRDFLHVA